MGFDGHFLNKYSESLAELLVEGVHRMDLILGNGSRIIALSSCSCSNLTLE